MENNKPHEKTNLEKVDLLTDYQIRHQLYDPQKSADLRAFERACEIQANPLSQHYKLKDTNKTTS